MYDDLHRVAAEPVEDHDLVEAFQEFRPEVAADGLHHLIAQSALGRSLRRVRQILASQVRGQHDQGVAEIDRPSLAVGHAALVEHLEQDVEDVRSEEHTSELQSLMRISYAVFCLKKKNLTTSNIAIY